MNTFPGEPMLNEPCFYCGAIAARRVEVSVGTSRVRHSTPLARHPLHRHEHVDTIDHSRLEPVCEKCITEQVEAAKAALKVAGGVFAVMGGTMFLFAVLPFVLCLLSAVGLGLWSWYTRP